MRHFQEQRKSLDFGELMKPLLQPTGLADMLKKTEEMMKLVAQHQKTEGYRQGAAMIRYFLK